MERIHCYLFIFVFGSTLACDIVIFFHKEDTRHTLSIEKGVGTLPFGSKMKKREVVLRKSSPDLDISIDCLCSEFVKN